MAEAPPEVPTDLPCPYEDLFRLCSEISELIDTLNFDDFIHIQESEKTATLIESKLSEADALIDHFGKFPPSADESRLREARVQTKKLRLRLNAKKGRTIGTVKRESMAFADLPTAAGKAQNQRVRLIEGTQKLNDQSDRLDTVIVVAKQTEEIGAATLGKLKMQTDQFQIIQSNADDVYANVERANKTITKMIKRKRMMYWIYLGVALVVLAIVLTAVLYYVKIAK